MPQSELWGWDSANSQWVKVLVNSAGKLIIDPSEILEDTPTDGQVGKAPTSNWAYDHAANVNAHHNKQHSIIDIAHHTSATPANKLLMANADGLPASSGIDYTDVIKHSLATAANDMLVASGSGAFVKKAIDQTKALFEWQGAGELYLPTLSTFGRKDTFEGPFNQSMCNIVLTGGRGSVSNLYAQTILTTGNQVADIAGVTDYAGFWLDNAVAGFRLKAYFHGQINNNTQKCVHWIGVTPQTYPTATSIHIGFIIAETAGAGDGHAELYATNGNGVAGTTTLLASNIAQYSPLYLLFKYTSGGIYFYRSTDFGVTYQLVATHTTNIPIAVSVYPALWLKTLEAVAKQSTLWSWRWTIGE